ncbi:MAG: hypothetical protein HC882_07645 [Acidobacteria bacterium]|nr:hypothetical protein [Acidobacteriota bacterium]
MNPQAMAKGLRKWLTDIAGSVAVAILLGLLAFGATAYVHVQNQEIHATKDELVEEVAGALGIALRPLIEAEVERQLEVQMPRAVAGTESMARQIQVELQGIRTDLTWIKQELKKGE